MGEIKEHLDRSINFLAKQPTGDHLLPPAFIHFQRQADYIQLNGERVISTIYNIKNLDRLARDICQATGGSPIAPDNLPGLPKANTTYLYRTDTLRRLFNAMQPLSRRLGKVVPISLKQSIYDRIYVPRDRKAQSLFKSRHVRDFVQSYYADDFRFLELES